MSVIGDALGRAERDYRADQIQNAVSPTRAAMPAQDESAEMAVKGIARPQQSAGEGGGWFSASLMTLFVAIIGLAGYMTLYPEWVDSLWKFPDPVKQMAIATRKSSASGVSKGSSLGGPEYANAFAPLVPTCPAEALYSPAERNASDVSPLPPEPALPEPASPRPGPSFQVASRPAIEPDRNVEPKPAVEPSVKKSSKPTAKRANPGKGRRVARTQTKPKPPRSITRIPVRTSDIKSRYNVDGVMLGGERKLAVINGEIVGVDEEVDGAVVRAITGSGVAVEVDGRIRRLPVRSKRAEDQESSSRSDLEFND